MDEGRGDLKTAIQARVAQSPPRTVWTPADFLDLGRRDAVDKARSPFCTAYAAGTNAGTNSEAPGIGFPATIATSIG